MEIMRSEVTCLLAPPHIHEESPFVNITIHTVQHIENNNNTLSPIIDISLRHKTD